MKLLEMSQAARQYYDGLRSRNLAQGWGKVRCYRRLHLSVCEQ